MALENISDNYKPTVEQSPEIVITDATKTTVVAAITSTRIKVVDFKISSDTAAEWKIYSGDTVIWTLYGGADWGWSERSEIHYPVFITNVGEAFFVEGSVASLNASVHVKYIEVD